MKFLIRQIEKVTVKNGHFTPKTKAFMRLVAFATIVLLGIDVILAAVRYGNFGLQNLSFYVISGLAVIILLLVSRSNAESSIGEMRLSSNIFVKGFAWALFLVFVVFGFIVEIVGNIFEGDNNDKPEEKEVGFYGDPYSQEDLMSHDYFKNGGRNKMCEPKHETPVDNWRNFS